jgi:integrase
LKKGPPGTGAAEGTVADIRKRQGRKGPTYQVRYASTGAKGGYAYATFTSLKEARAFLEGGDTKAAVARRDPEIGTVADAAEKWLRVCESEGLNGREPVSKYTYENYAYRVSFIKAYPWPKPIHQLEPPDVVAFRSWLLEEGNSRAVASKVLSTLHSVLKEMTIRGVLHHNFAQGICVRAESRYEEPVSIPSKQEIIALLAAADELAASPNESIRKTWRRYRPILYLAVDSGMRPQEYLALSRSAIRDNGVFVDRAIDGGSTEISVTKTPAGRRFIEISPHVIDMIRHYAREHAVKNDYDLVFPSTNGKWISRQNWQRRGFDVACIQANLVETPGARDEQLKLPKYRPYDLRHFFASMHIEKGTNLKKLQTLMGHANIETTLNVYGHLLDDDENLKKPSEGILSAIAPAKTCGKSVARTLQAAE